MSGRRKSTSSQVTSPSLPIAPSPHCPFPFPSFIECMGPFKSYVTHFFWKFDTPHNANNVAPYTFVTLEWPLLRVWRGKEKTFFFFKILCDT